MKECSKCKEIKPYTEFHKHQGNKDGYNFQCRDCRKAGSAAYYSHITDEQKTKRNESKKRWAQDNKEKVMAYSKEYAKNNSATRTASQRKREASKLQRTPLWLTEEDFLRIRCLYQVARMRTEETGYLWHVDHIIPLQGKNVCGLHIPWNLQVIPATENLRKYNKHE